MNKSYLPHFSWLRPLLVLFVASPILALAQGSLTPPGPPGPLMKSLDQIEPRIPVDAVHTPGDASDQFIISQAGSYYLTTNIIGVTGKNGIEINSDNVTLDLNGFAVLGGGVSASGIYSSGRDVTVRNGTVKSWGFYGITDAANSSMRLFDRLTVCSNGIDGIDTSQGAIIRDCIIEGNSSFGIYANGASRISGCIADGNGQGGIAIEPPGGCVVMDNFAFGNDTAANRGDIYMNSGGNHIEGNRVIVTSTTGYGIYVFAVSSNTNNVIIKNDVAGGGTRNFNIITGNDLGPIGTAATSTSPWANISH